MDYFTDVRATVLGLDRGSSLAVCEGSESSQIQQKYLHLMNKDLTRLERYKGELLMTEFWFVDEQWHWPEEDEDGLSVGHSVQVFIEVQVRFNTVDQSGMHFIHLIKDEHWTWADGNIPSYPLL